jgi:ATP-binding cassette subfamily B protein
MLARLLRKHLAPYASSLCVVVVLQLMGTIASLYLPRLNAEIIDQGVLRGDTDTILRTGAVMLAASLFQGLCSIIAVFFGSRTAMSFGHDLRAATFHHALSFSSREMARFGAPTLLTRSTNDVQQIQMLVLMTFTMLVSAPIMMIGGIVMALRQDAGMSWIVVAMAPILAVILGLIITRMIPGFRAMQTKLDAVNQVLREQTSGIRVVRAFVREMFEEKRFATANDDLTEVAVSVGRWMAAMFPSVMLVMNVATVAVLWFGGQRVDDGATEIGSLTAFLTYVIQILMAVMMSTMMLMILPRAAAAGERIGEVLHTSPSVLASATAVTTLTNAGALDLENVGVHFPGASASVLSGVTVSARPGTTLAIVGSTGSGKSTLVSLAPRLLDVTEGAVKLGGVDVRAIDADALASRIGFVPQKAYLFTGTIASNLRYGKVDASDDEMWRALEIAQAKDFVEAMPEGLASPVAQGGTNLSGGQRQRIAIARALIRRPEVYLFDDSFSALDVATDARLRRALKLVTREATVVIVAQRVATIVDADRIVVLEKGRVVGIGTHDELVKSCATYAEIVSSQLAAEAA